MDDFRAQRVPDNVPTAPMCSPDLFDPIRFTVEFAPDALAMPADGFRWFVEQELEDLRRDVMRAYYDARD